MQIWRGPTLLVSLLVCSFFGSLLGSPVVARANRDEEARVHFSAGASYYSRGEYERALQEFLIAQELSGRATLYYNISLCHQQLGHLGEAADALELYLREVPDLQDRDLLEARLVNLRRRIEERAKDESLVEVDDPVQLTETLEGDETSGEAAAEPAPRAPRPPPPAWSYVGFGVAGAGVAVAATFGGLALQHKNGIEGDCGRDATCTPSDVRRMDRFALAADIGIGVAVAGAVVGVVGLLVKRSPREDRGALGVQVAPLVDARRGTLGLSAGGRF